MKNKNVTIIENNQIGQNQFYLKISWDDFNSIKSGNFFMIGINNGSKILKRPIAIFDYDQNDKWVGFIYNLIGKGTKELSEYSKGETINVLGPVGNHFEDYNNKKILIVAGGTGIFPMHLFSKLNAHKNEIKMILGFRSKKHFNSYEYYNNLDLELLITTDDGSLGTKATPIDLLQDLVNNFKPDVVLTCGPEILMNKTYLITSKLNIKTYGSFENRMGCGFGVCMGCSIKTKNGMKRVCYDGPIFDMSCLELEHEQ